MRIFSHIFVSFFFFFSQRFISREEKRRKAPVCGGGGVSEKLSHFPHILFRQLSCQLSSDSDQYKNKIRWGKVQFSVMFIWKHMFMIFIAEFDFPQYCTTWQLCNSYLIQTCENIVCLSVCLSVCLLLTDWTQSLTRGKQTLYCWAVSSAHEYYYCHFEEEN
jgi:hypothetical protein